MKKLITTIFLLLFITIVGSFSVIKLGSVGAEDNYFNSKWRSRVAQFPQLRTIFGLHFDGDARFDYLGPRYKNIIIEVDSMDGLLPDKKVLKQLADRIEKVTGKLTSYELSDIDLPFEESSDKNLLDSLSARYRNKRTQGDTAAVYLLIINHSADKPLTIGKTHQEYGIILYSAALKEFTDNHPNTFSNYELSTALHEFGHQLGLPHNDQPSCLMGEHAESDYIAKADPDLVVTDFCDYEKTLVNTLWN